MRILSRKHYDFIYRFPNFGSNNRYITLDTIHIVIKPVPWYPSLCVPVTLCLKCSLKTSRRSSCRSSVEEYPSESFSQVTYLWLCSSRIHFRSTFILTLSSASIKIIFSPTSSVTTKFVFQCIQLLWLIFLKSIY